MKKKIITLILAISTVFMLATPLSVQAVGFSDVSPDEWFYDDVMLLSKWGLVNGMGDGTFEPDSMLKRGEFMKMLAYSAEMYTTTPSKGIHWAEQYWHTLNDNDILKTVEMNSNGSQYERPLIPLTFQSLDANITRYEMAYMINRVLYMVYREKPMTLINPADSYANHITDYETMDKSFAGSVEQVFSKGIVTGYTDGTFGGGNVLRRAEAATVIVRLMWGNKREAQSFATEKDIPAPEPDFISFSTKYRNMTNAERRTALFGNPNKTHFRSAADASGYIVDITVPIWKLNESSGEKYSSTARLQVHRLIEKEVKAIFNDIYNSPEKFPIKDIGGARYSDTMRHSWGCAIDINANENYYLHYSSGTQVGSLWEPGINPYSITPNGSVVKAFAKQGWGWGGQGWSTAVDYMHFSILASGG